MSYKFCSICGGRLKLRPDDNLACTKCDFVNYRNPRPTATALVLHKNKLLLTRRARAPYKGSWDLPGGFIDRGEDPKRAVVRELKEETRLDISVKKIFGIYPDEYTHGSDSFHTLCIIYVAAAKASSLGAFDDVSESKWFAKKDMPKKIAFKSNQRAIKDFLKIWK
ncbi:MAG: NUDIX hydrolase [Parcubacteria group bacterium]|nr:NUDIX hydrolase [Parcubacteria group bacterium]